jgi:hypothetical protein
MKPLGVLWHSTGANNTTLKRYVQPSDIKPAEDTYDKAKWIEVLGKNQYNNDWNHIDRQAGLNCWIGKLANGSVATVQTMPWNYKPWGCGKGSKGSCNSGWMQFEICEDGLTDAAYFNAVYKEACEITAYYCKMYNIDPKGTVDFNGVKVPTILCHYDSWKLGLGSNHGDVDYWFKKHGKTMADVRNDVAAILAGSSNEPSPSKTPEPTPTTKGTIKVGDLVSITANAVYYGGTSIPSWVRQKNWYVSSINSNYCVIDKSEDGKNSICSPIEERYLVKLNNDIVQEPKPVVKTYQVVVNLPTYSNEYDASGKKNVKGAYAPGTYYIYTKYPDGVNGMLNITKDKTGTTPGSWINPTENVVKVEEPVVQKVYRVRTSWTDEKSQKGAFADLINAKNCCQEAGTGYKVYDWDGKQVYEYVAPVVTKPVEEPKQEETTAKKAVYDLDYPNKHLIIDNGVAKEFDKEICTKAIIAILKNNSAFNVEIAKVFFTLAPKYRINPLRAISQSILETGWFKFAGSSVKPEQNNYCGLGATGGGVPGAAFDSVEAGVRAQLQHLYAYGCKDALPVGEETIIDPRFKYVERGIATYWEQLAGRWACPGFDGDDAEASMKAGTTYGQKIDNIYERLLVTAITTTDIENYFKEQESQSSSNDNTVIIDNEKPDNKAVDTGALVSFIGDLLIKIVKVIINFFTRNG